VPEAIDKLEKQEAKEEVKKDAPPAKVNLMLDSELNDYSPS